MLVHAAAGGVGLLLTQIAKRRGGRVIATTSTDEKAQLARGAGADETIGYEGFAERARELTGGEGVAAVYDGIGADTFDESLAALRPRGYMVLYGAASGQPPPVEIAKLNAGSLFLTRPTLTHYGRDGDELRMRSADFLGWIAAGELDVRIGARYPLEDAARAQADLAVARDDRQAAAHALVLHSRVLLWFLFAAELGALAILAIQRGASERRGGELVADRGAHAGASGRRWRRARQRQAGDPELPLDEPRIRRRVHHLVTPCGLVLSVPGLAAVIVSELPSETLLLAFAVATLAGMDVAILGAVIVATWRGWMPLPDDGGGGEDEEPEPEPLPGGPWTRAHQFNLRR